MVFGWIFSEGFIILPHLFEQFWISSDGYVKLLEIDQTLAEEGFSWKAIHMAAIWFLNISGERARYGCGRIFTSLAPISGHLFYPIAIARICKLGGVEKDTNRSAKRWRSRTKRCSKIFLETPRGMYATGFGAVLRPWQKLRVTTLSKM